jgi:hypothetical protein
MRNMFHSMDGNCALHYYKLMELEWGEELYITSYSRN